MKSVQRALGNARAGGMVGNGKQPVQAHLRHENVQRQPAGQIGSTGATNASAYVTEDLKIKMTATVLAESFAGQGSEIRWMYETA